MTKNGGDDMQEIDIEEIMQEIRAEIKEKGYKESDLSFHDIPIKSQNEVMIEEQFSEQRLQELLHLVNVSTNVNYYRNFTGNIIKTFIKKVIRKILAPLILPLCQEQEQYNSSVTRTLNQMYQYMRIQEKRIEELETMICNKEV